MSKIIRSANIVDLKPWQAPSLSLSGAVAAGIDPRQLPGYEDGFDQGHQAGQEAARQQMQKSVDALAMLVQTVQQPLADIDAQVEDELVQLAMAIAGQVIRRELRTDPEQIAAVVKEARRSLAEITGSLRIGLHPGDAPLVRGMFSKDKELDGIVIEEDISLSPGGCTLSTRTSFVDARLETRIAKIAVQLLGDHRTLDVGQDEQSTPQPDPGL